MAGGIMTRKFLLPVFLLIAAPAWAQEPVGCDKFKWPLDHERALLAKAAQAASGSEAVVGTATSLSLVPFADAKLPQAPSRKPKYPDSYAGFAQFAAPATTGTYKVTLSHRAWVDVVQDGHDLKLTAFTGATGCDGLAKSVKFDLTATPFTVELSGTSAHAVAFVVTSD